MYGFKNTECILKGCVYPVWPNKTLGYCSRHYQRNRTGRMDYNGELTPFPPRDVVCGSCGEHFKTVHAAEKWCHKCKPKEYLRIIEDNKRNIYRRGHHKGWEKKQKEAYMGVCLDSILR